MVEVDTSEVGVGTVLSQCSLMDSKVQTCAYFSHRLSPAGVDGVEGSHSLSRGNVPARGPTGSVVCARGFKVQSYPVGSLFKSSLPSWG